MMQHKINKNYLGKALQHFDTDGNQIIDPEEWLSYFSQIPDADTLWQNAKDLLIHILTDVFPNEDQERLPVLAQAIIINHSENTKTGKKINFMRLYNYVIRFIAPQKYREYQATLEDKTQFFLYDGIIEREEFEIFTDKNNRLLTADIYYFVISYHIDPSIASQIIDHIIDNPTAMYHKDNFSLDAEGVFQLLSIEKNKKWVIDIDAITSYMEECGISNNHVDNVCHLFGIHNDLAEYVQDKKEVSYKVAYNFLNFHNKTYLELAIESLFQALYIQLEDIHDVLKLVEFLGYVGKPEKIFREIAGIKKSFNSSDIQEFLDDNHIPYSLK